MTLTTGAQGASHTRRQRALEGRAALVTGGGSGIGRATAVALAELGAAVVVSGRRREALEQTAAMHPAIKLSAGDVSQLAAAQRIVHDAVRLCDRLDILVNNAGSVTLTPLGETTPHAAQALWATNVLGPTWLAQEALPHLERARGSIVNVSSTFGHRPAPGISQYGASKAALEQLTLSWALELADRGIRVNAVAPGPTESEALANSGLPLEQIEAVKEQERQRIPLGRRGDPDDVARWIVALSDPEATWITGEVIGVDGGFGLV